MTDRGRVSFAGAYEDGVGAQAARATSAASPAATAAVDLGPLPQWRLDDLYEGMDSPRFAADLARAAAEAKRFAATYRGKLAELAQGAEAGRRLFEAVRAYEALQDLMGRIMSYAALLYAGDTSDPARAKFYGDAQEKVTALAGELLFFELELNRLDDAGLDAAMRRSAARPLPAVARGHPQGEAVPARRRARAAVPRKVDAGRGRLEPAVRRDDRVAALRGRRRGADARADAPSCRIPTEAKREAAAEALASDARRQSARCSR